MTLKSPIKSCFVTKILLIYIKVKYYRTYIVYIDNFKLENISFSIQNFFGILDPSPHHNTSVYQTSLVETAIIRVISYNCKVNKSSTHTFQRKQS